MTNESEIDFRKHTAKGKHTLSNGNILEIVECQAHGNSRFGHRRVVRVVEMDPANPKYVRVNCRNVKEIHYSWGNQRGTNCFEDYRTGRANFYLEIARREAYSQFQELVEIDKCATSTDRAA